MLGLLMHSRPDVVECLDAYNLPWTALAYRRRRPRVLVVGGYRTDFPRAYVEAGTMAAFGRGRVGRTTARAARRLAERYAVNLYRRMDAVYTLSNDAAERLQDGGVRVADVLPLGVDTALFHPRRRDPTVRVPLGVPTDAPLLVYAGRLDREKRPLDLVEALPNVPRAHLLLLGHGPHRQAALDRADALGLAGRVHAPGFVASRAELARSLASSDVYVSAMAHETFGVSVVEAQACGLPVVGVEAGAMVDRVPPGLGLLAPPRDAGAFAAAVCEVLDGDLAESRARARDHVVARFSWDRTFDRLLALYRRALAERRAGAAS